jgi:hypothetical protein
VRAAFDTGEAEAEVASRALTSASVVLVSSMPFVMRYNADDMTARCYSPATGPGVT